MKLLFRALPLHDSPELTSKIHRIWPFLRFKTEKMMDD